MYVPKAFQVSDSRVLADFVASNSFATLRERIVSGEWLVPGERMLHWEVKRIR